MPTLAQARALQAFSKGEASPEQQKTAFNFIVMGLCRAGREIMSPGQGDMTAYFAGRLSVSLQMGWILNQRPEDFRAKGETD